VTYLNYTDPIADIFGNKNVGQDISYGSDDFSIAGISLNQMPFIEDDQVIVSSGTNALSSGQTQYWNYSLGLGLPSTVAAVAANNPAAALYPGFLGLIKNQGRIQSSTYSIVSLPLQTLL
jgi:hypothetical protein